ncbi:hypothetical protein O0S10_00820 [Methanocorpusculum sp. MG]|uniref:Uncharacterized protein n=1 Tax=Methanocorpusculum petauri TaxID=3002863 RepID=A0ABT4IDD9_9EURY|nr:hypothetical protein [Methanocorpusculum petauri]MCZ0859765.1 hypothetical protein [Methanocorpusculum petauri]
MFNAGHPDAVNLASSISPVSFNVGIGMGALLGSVVVNAVLLTRGNCGTTGVCYR